MGLNYFNFPSKLVILRYYYCANVHIFDNFLDDQRTHINSVWQIFVHALTTYRHTPIVLTNLQQLKARTTRISTKMAVSESAAKTTSSSANIVYPKQHLREIGAKLVNTITKQKPAPIVTGSG